MYPKILDIFWTDFFFFYWIPQIMLDSYFVCRIINQLEILCKSCLAMIHTHKNTHMIRIAMVLEVSIVGGLAMEPTTVHHMRNTTYIYTIKGSNICNISSSMVFIFILFCSYLECEKYLASRLIHFSDSFCCIRSSTFEHIQPAHSSKCTRIWTQIVRIFQS